jgi:hypothetical protein
MITILVFEIAALSLVYRICNSYTPEHCTIYSEYYTLTGDTNLPAATTWNANIIVGF